MKKLKILFLEPFFGGSHRDFAEGLAARSGHDIELQTLPARFWKWRTRGAALHFLESIDDWGAYDLLVTCGLMSLADLKALAPVPLPPTVLYLHESQLSYPLAPGESFDAQFGFTDITSCLAAERVVFNSHVHRDRFLAELPQFIRRMPDFRPRGLAERIAEKSAVLYPGIDLTEPEELSVVETGPPVILWNHRWEFDKNPELFFSVLDRLDDEGFAFRLLVLGESYSRIPDCFAAARERYADRILAWGFRPDRAGYRRLLTSADIVVSCALQENFGLAVVEAIAAGARPLLPDRLSYPEILPETFHRDHLYRDGEELYSLLRELLTKPRPADPGLTRAMEQYGWERCIGAYDELFAATAGNGGIR